MHDAKDAQTTAVQEDTRTTSEKRSAAAQKRWTLQRAQELGLQLLEEQAKEPKVRPPTLPLPTSEAGWREKIQQKLWEALNSGNDKVLLALSRFLELGDATALSAADEHDLLYLRKIRAMSDAELEGKRRELLAVINRPRVYAIESEEANQPADAQNRLDALVSNRPERTKEINESAIKHPKETNKSVHEPGKLAPQAEREQDASALEADPQPQGPVTAHPTHAIPDLGAPESDRTGPSGGDRKWR